MVLGPGPVLPTTAQDDEMAAEFVDSVDGAGLADTGMSGAVFACVVEGARDGAGCGATTCGLTTCVGCLSGAAGRLSLRKMLGIDMRLKPNARNPLSAGRVSSSVRRVACSLR